MKETELKQLYRELILPESRNPFYYSEAEIEEPLGVAYNPLCGDKYEWTASLHHRLDQFQFSGMGCALSKASLSILFKNIKGMDSENALVLIQEFIHVVEDSEKSISFPSRPEVEKLALCRSFEGRLDCLLLGWKSAEEQLKSII